MAQKRDPRVEKAMSDVLEMFRDGRALDVAAIATLPRVDCPSGRWSLSNRFIMLLNNTSDARGFRQWEQVGRRVKKGAKAFHILAPRVVTRKDEDTGEDLHFVAGFLGVAVFRFEDTEGEPLPDLAPVTPPPLADVAEKLGLTVEYHNLAGAYGSFNQHGDRITLDTHDARVFWHELAHAAHARVNGGLKGGQHWDQETLAEFVSAVISRIYQPDVPLGFEFKYITDYAKGAGLCAEKACLHLLRDAEKVLALIFENAC